MSHVSKDALQKDVMNIIDVQVTERLTDEKKKIKMYIQKKKECFVCTKPEDIMLCFFRQVV